MTKKQKFYTLAVLFTLLLGICVVRLVQTVGALKIERSYNRHYALTMHNNTAWTLHEIKPNPLASPSRMDVDYVFVSGSETLSLVVSIPNPNKVWYDKVWLGQTVYFVPTINVGDASVDPTLSTYIRPENFSGIGAIKKAVSVRGF